MSELSSLFVKLKIKKENLDRFFAAPLTTPAVDKDWTSWWDSREMYSKAPLEKIPTGFQPTNGAVFQSLLDDKQTMSEEKREAGMYYFVSVFFSENYYEILPMLAILKSIAGYMEEGDEGVAFIYDFFWGGQGVLAHMEITAGKAVLKETKHTSEINKALLTEANERIQHVLDNVPEDYND